MAVEPLRTVKDHLSELVRRVEAHHERIEITRNGRRSAVLISPDELEAIEETLEILSDTEAVAELVAARRAVAQGDVVWRGRSPPTACRVTEESYGLAVAGPAARAIAATLPKAVASAAIELITGPLVENPHRVGRELRGPLGGIWTVRRGDYRVLYEIDDEHREVIVLRVAHRSDIYRRWCRPQRPRAPRVAATVRRSSGVVSGRRRCSAPLGGGRSRPRGRRRGRGGVRPRRARWGVGLRARLASGRAGRPTS